MTCVEYAQALLPIVLGIGAGRRNARHWKEFDRWPDRTIELL